MRAVIFFVCLCALVYLTKLYAESKSVENVPTVEVVAVKLESVPRVISSNGIAKPIRGIIIVPEVAGVVTKVQFKSGQSVVAGQILLELNHQDVSAELAQEVAKKAYLARNFQRYVTLAKQGVIARDSLDKIRSDFAAENAKVDELNAVVEKRIIRAPFTGVLGLKQINLGQYLQAGDQIVSLQQNQAVLIDLSIPPQQIENINIGEDVEVAVSASRNVNGKIVAIDSKMNEKTYALQVRVKVVNVRQEIFPGTYVTARILLPSKDKFITLPQSALHYGLNGESIYVVRHHHAYQRLIQSEAINDQIIVKQGLQQDEQVVIAGQDKLYDGISVDAKLTS